MLVVSTSADSAATATTAPVSPNIIKNGISGITSFGGVERVVSGSGMVKQTRLAFFFGRYTLQPEVQDNGIQGEVTLMTFPDQRENDE